MLARTARVFFWCGKEDLNPIFSLRLHLHQKMYKIWGKRHEKREDSILIFPVQSAFRRLRFFIKPDVSRLLFFVQSAFRRLLFSTKLAFRHLLFGEAGARGGGGSQKRDILFLRIFFPKGVKI